MKNVIDEVFNIVQRPDDVGGRWSSKGELHRKLATSLKVMDRTKAVSFHIDEVKKLFGKCFRSTLKYQMRKLGVEVCVGLKDATVFVWRKEKA